MIGKILGRAIALPVRVVNVPVKIVNATLDRPNDFGTKDVGRCLDRLAERVEDATEDALDRGER